MAQAHAQCLFLAVKPVTPGVIHFLYDRALAWTKKKLKKKRSLRNEKLEANTTSETEEQRKERLRIRREKDRARRRTKGKKRSPDTDDYEKVRLATLKRLKRGEVDLRLEKVVASKQLRLALETEEERRTRLEAFLKSWQLCLSFKLLQHRHPQLKEILIIIYFLSFFLICT